jgi:hypothetical protein
VSADADLRATSKRLRNRGAAQPALFPPQVLLHSTWASTRMPPQPRSGRAYWSGPHQMQVAISFIARCLYVKSLGPAFKGRGHTCAWKPKSLEKGRSPKVLEAWQVRCCSARHAAGLHASLPTTPNCPPHAVTGAGPASPTLLLFSNFTDPPPPALAEQQGAAGSSATAAGSSGGGLSTGAVVAIAVASALGKRQIVGDYMGCIECSQLGICSSQCSCCCGMKLRMPNLL